MKHFLKSYHVRPEAQAPKGVKTGFVILDVMLWGGRGDLPGAGAVAGGRRLRCPARAVHGHHADPVVGLLLGNLWSKWRF